MAGEILSQILVLLAASVLVLSLVRRFSLPPILGYLVVGMLLGPHALALVANDEAIRQLAEIGVVFLVFTLGLEFSLARMIAMKSEVLGIGGLQMPSRPPCSAAQRGRAASNRRWRSCSAVRSRWRRPR
jgi:CPA2 family monovalent cation:H+ antiporter-2